MTQIYIIKEVTSLLLLRRHMKTSEVVTLRAALTRHLSNKRIFVVAFNIARKIYQPEFRAPFHISASHVRAFHPTEKRGMKTVRGRNGKMCFRCLSV